MALPPGSRARSRASGLPQSPDCQLVDFRREVWRGPGGSVSGGGGVVPAWRGSERIVTRDHHALARAVHRHGVGQANHREKSVHLTFLVTHERKRAVLGLEPPEGVEENVHPGRVHERDLGQIYDDRTGLALEDLQQELPQHRGSREIDFALDTEHRPVPMLIVSR